eukprot:2336231-Prymnesium_polylepis.1
MPGGEDASPGHAGELVARSCVLCRLSCTYSEVTYSIYKHRVICLLRCLNTDANDHARLTGQLGVLGRAECDIGYGDGGREQARVRGRANDVCGTCYGPTGRPHAVSRTGHASGHNVRSPPGKSQDL